VGAIIIRAAFGCGQGGGDPPSTMSVTPAIVTPAAAARTSARARASATAAVRAPRSASRGSLTRNASPSRLVAPAVSAPSTTPPRSARSRTVTSTTFDKSYPVSVGALPSR
jgi:hypothetical protein